MRNLWILLVAILLIGTLACGSDNAEKSPSASMPSKEPIESIIITIGNLTDKTGPSANAMSIIDKALADVVQYYNDQDLIPGVSLEIQEYDGRYDPSADIPGYIWLKENGADLIWTGAPATPTTLESRVNEDQILLFTPGPSREAIEPPGYIFAPTVIPEDNAYTILQWIYANDPDFPQGRPAKVGAAGWDTPYNVSLHAAGEEYATAHSDQYEWVGSFTTPRSFVWGPEVEALKACDYVFVPVMMMNFIKEYRTAGYAAKFLATGSQTAFLRLITDARLWDELDGTLFFLPAGWWNDESELIEDIYDLLYSYRPNEAQEIIESGNAYMAADAITQMVQIVANAVGNVGAEDFDSQALYDAAMNYTDTKDGIMRATFSETKRASLDYLGVYEADSTAQYLFRIQEDWVPVLHGP